MQDVIQTPFFMFNSKYDAWQLGNEFQSNWQTKAEQDGVLQYGLDFMQQLAPIYTGSETKHGGMITSCICHGCPWPALKLAGKTSYEHYADWFYGKTTGAASMHIDPSLPNGNGAGSPRIRCCSVCSDPQPAGLRNSPGRRIPWMRGLSGQARAIRLHPLANYACDGPRLHHLSQETVE